jgi:hypothetical protein
MPQKKAELPKDLVSPPQVGRPTDYSPEMCDQLIDHMRQGNSFESFGAVVMKGRNTLFEWAKAHKEFQDAKEMGSSLCLKFYLDLGKMAAAGQLRRLTKEEPIMVSDGKGGHKPAIDPSTGQVLYRREYVAAQPAQAIWIFIMKNIHKWRDNVEVTMSEGSTITLAYAPTEPTKEERDKYALKK